MRSKLIESFQIDAVDNVATLLQDANAGAEVRVSGSGGARMLMAAEAIRTGHKIALCAIAEGEALIKYGTPIGIATAAIHAGDWVHLHNCRSAYDAGSSALDNESGSRTETRYV